jgi:hypothetical protein
MFGDRKLLMARNNGHFEQDNSSGFSDETIRRFLLGELSGSEQPLFEQQLFTDAGLDARVRLAEIDLADDYAFERLNAADRALFEPRFLVTARRQQMFRVSTALREHLSSKRPTAAWSEKSTVAGRWRNLFGFNRSAWKIAFGVLILLILFGTVLLVVKEPRFTQQITNKVFPRRSAPRSSPQEMHHPTNTSSPEHQTTPAPLPLHESANPLTESAVLFPTEPDLGKISTLTLPNGENNVVRLRLAVIDQTVPYRAEVLTIDGKSVFSVDRLSGPPFNVDVSASLLKSGKYQIRLSDARDGSKKEVASYYFWVQ